MFTFTLPLSKLRFTDKGQLQNERYVTDTQIQRRHGVKSTLGRFHQRKNVLGNAALLHSEYIRMKRIIDEH